MRWSVETGDAGETEDFARSLAARLAPGRIVLLFGELGAGKTAFVRGLAAGLGLDPADVSSPTFTLVQEYRVGARRFQHVDLYRVRPGPEVDDLGLDEFTARGDIVAVEWPDRLASLPEDAMVVTIADLGGNRRRILVTEGEPSPSSG
jgi:tRNA threonylcarbamoyladenosine biosynthesis protein TsaE